MEEKERGEQKEKEFNLRRRGAGRTGGICANVKREQKTEVVSSNVHVHPAFTT